jgi:hypothetical protein
MIYNPETGDTFAKISGGLYKNGLPIARDEFNDGVDVALKTIDDPRFAGNIYRNQLRWPDAAREASDPLSDKHFLDWDKPLSEQSPEVQAALAKLDPDTYHPSGDDFDPSEVGQMVYSRIPRGASGDPRIPSNRLRELGIPGIRYLDGGSRGAGQGTSNYVTFSDDLVNILERNGVPVTAPQPGLKK